MKSRLIVIIVLSAMGGCAHRVAPAPVAVSLPPAVLASIEAPQALIDSISVVTPSDTADIIRIPPSFSNDVQVCIEGIPGNDPACLTLNELRAIAAAKRLVH